MIIVDAHLDLTFNVLVDGRNELQSALEIRARERDGAGSQFNGICMVGLPGWLEGEVALVGGTLFALPRAEAGKGEPGYANPEAALQMDIARLNNNRRRAAEHPQITLVTTGADLDGVLASWEDGVAPDRRRIAIVVIIENADSIRGPEEVAYWFDQGVRVIGPAREATRYTGSQSDCGPLTDLGRGLLDQMSRFGMLLDLSHVSEAACLESLARYPGPAVATHANPQRIVARPKLLLDEVIRGTPEHGGVVGILPVNWALDPTWRAHADTPRVTLEAVVDAIDAVCQITGSTTHVGIGSDFDGGQGAGCAPAALDTLADLRKIGDRLAGRG